MHIVWIYCKKKSIIGLFICNHTIKVKIKCIYNILLMYSSDN